MYTQFSGSGSREFLAQADTTVFDKVPLDSPVARYDITYCFSAHGRAVDYDPDWDQLIRQADIVFHEGHGWSAHDDEMINRIARGSRRALRKHWPDKERFGWRKAKATLKTGVTQRYWDITATEAERQGTNALQDRAAQLGAEATTDVILGNVGDGLECMRAADEQLFRFGIIRDAIGMQRIIRSANTHTEAESPRHDDGVYKLVVFAGLQHLVQAIALARKLGNNPDINVGAANTTTQLQSAINNASTKFVGGGELSLEDVARDWAHSLLMTHYAAKNPDVADSAIRGQVQTQIAETEFEGIKQIISTRSRAAFGLPPVQI